jgi:ribonuclease III
MAKRASPDLSELEKNIQYRFTQKSLLLCALTHISALSTQESRNGSYQRLEFLGDRVLGLSISALLIQTFPDAPEGELSRRLAALVRKETCTDVAKNWQVGLHLRLGVGELQSGGRKKAAILADVCEAIVGAVFLDGGFEAAKKVVEHGFKTLLHQPHQRLKDAKTTLQEWAQAQGYKVPTYHLVARKGADHAPTFSYRVHLEGMEDAVGEGKSRALAEQNAAENFMRREKLWQNSETNSEQDSLHTHRADPQ